MELAFEHHFTHRAAEDYDSPEESVYILNLLQLIVQMQFTQKKITIGFHRRHINIYMAKNFSRHSQT